VASSGEGGAEGVLGYGSHEHHSWEFFRNPKDKQGIKQGMPGYNPRTWHVPSSFLKEQTPAMIQWFDLKCENFDTVLFFKVRIIMNLVSTRRYLTTACELDAPCGVFSDM
jgi:DNA mismatch repair protein MSH6